MASVTIGTCSGKNLNIYGEARSTHMHVLGISGQGKSYFLEQTIREDILNGHGVCVIDPHGELYDNLSRWIVENNIDSYRKVHLLNPSHGAWTFGWNPLCTENGLSLSARVNAMVDAFVKVWGGGDMSQTPRLRKCLEAVLYALAYNKLSLAEARFLTRLQYKDIAKQLTADLGDEQYEDLWHEFLYEYPDRTFIEYFDSTISRLLPFVGDPVIRQIVGQTENLLNFRECMDDRHIVLINLGRGRNLTDESSKLLGALLTTDMYNSAFGRDVAYAQATPFYVTIDECADYVTDTIAKSLDQTRKFGLHLTLSHQRLWQLREYGDNLYNAVMANAQIKVVFKVGDDETADVMSRHLFRREFDLELPKHVLDKPIVVGYDVIWLHSESETAAHLTGMGEGSGTSTGLGSGLSQMFGTDGSELGGYTQIQNENEGLQTSVSYFTSESSASSSGRSETLMPQLQVLPTATYSLEELVHFGMHALLSLPKRQAYVYSPELKPQRFSTKHLETASILNRAVDRAVDSIGQASAYSLTHRVALNAIMSRRDGLFERYAPQNKFIEDDDYDPDSYME